MANDLVQSSFFVKTTGAITVFGELLVFAFLFIVFQFAEQMWAFHVFIGLFVLSGIWKNRPITANSAILAFFIHLVSPIIGAFALLIFGYKTPLGEFGSMVASYMIVGFIYFSSNLRWGWGWRIGAALATPFVMALGYWWFLPLTGWNGFTSYILFPLLLWRISELGYALIQKFRP
jgi:hypothetical protein